MPYVMERYTTYFIRYGTFPVGKEWLVHGGSVVGQHGWPTMDHGWQWGRRPIMDHGGPTCIFAISPQILCAKV